MKGALLGLELAVANWHTKANFLHVTVSLACRSGHNDNIHMIKINAVHTFNGQSTPCLPSW